jgi:dihydrofolate reductase
MRKLIVSEWLSLDGVFDAETMGQWWFPYDSEQRVAHIQGVIGAAAGFVLGRRTYEMLAPYWSTMKNNEMGVAANLNGAPKYLVSSTLETGSWNNTTIYWSWAAPSSCNPWQLEAWSTRTGSSSHPS